MISCIVVDDEPLALEGLEKYIKQTPFLELVGAFNSSKEALTFLEQNKVDLMLLDIQMPGMTGIELLKSLNNPPKVIFTTAYREYAFEGFQLDAVDYLLKPIDYNRFLKSIHKVLTQNDKDSNEESIFIKCDGVITRVIISDILYAETAKDYVFIYTEKERYMSLFSLKQLESFLPSNQFYRVHRSFLANLSKVEKIEGNLLHIGPFKISCSRNVKEVVTSIIVGNRFIQRNSTDE